MRVATSIPHAGSTQTFRDAGDPKIASASASRTNHHAVRVRPSDRTAGIGGRRPRPRSRRLRIFERPRQANRIPLATLGMSDYVRRHNLTPTPVAYYGSDKFNDYSCVTFNPFVDKEIRKSTLSGRVLPIISVSHITSWLTGRYIKNTSAYQIYRLYLCHT